VLKVSQSQKFSKKSTHCTIIISGVFRGGIDVLVRAKLACSDGVNMQLTVRSQDPDVSELITSTIG
jgi:coatomer protein complex subunit gamma